MPRRPGPLPALDAQRRPLGPPRPSGPRREPVETRPALDTPRGRRPLPALLAKPGRHEPRPPPPARRVAFRCAPRAEPGAADLGHLPAARAAALSDQAPPVAQVPHRVARILRLRLRLRLRGRSGAGRSAGPDDLSVVAYRRIQETAARPAGGEVYDRDVLDVRHRRRLRRSRSRTGAGRSPSPRRRPAVPRAC